MDVDLKGLDGKGTSKRLGRLLNDSRWAARIPQTERTCPSSLAVAMLTSEPPIRCALMKLSSAMPSFFVGA